MAEAAGISVDTSALREENAWSGAKLWMSKHPCNFITGYDCGDGVSPGGGRVRPGGAWTSPGRGALSPGAGRLSPGGGLMMSG